MTGFLIDEMFPTSVAELLRADGHEAAHVRELGLVGAEDAAVAEAARHRHWPA